jgi:hypothetical protein
MLTPRAPFSTLLAVLFAVMLGSACDSSSKTFVAPAVSRCAVTASASTTNFPAGGGSGTLQISAARECAWTARSDASWVALPSEAGGQGDASIRFSIAGNAEPGARVAALTVSDIRMQISQDGRPCDFRLSSTHEAVDASGGVRTIAVEASHPACAWSAAAQTPWLTIAGGSSRTGSGDVRVDVAASTQTRSGSVLIAGHVVTIEQVSCLARPGTTSVSVSHTGGRIEIPVTALGECPWSASSEAGWMNLVGTARGAGSGAVIVDVTMNPGTSRSGTIVVAGQSVTVQQGSSCTGVPAITSASVTAAGGRVEIPVLAAAGCSWTAGSEASWLSMESGSSGSGPGSVVLTAAATNGPSRQGAVQVSGVRVTVTQQSGCHYSVQPLSYTAPAAGVSGGITLQTGAGCPWTAASSDGWLSISRASGEGPAAIPLVVSPNQAPPRSASLTIAGIGVSVRQESPCTWALAPPAVDYGAPGGPGAILVLVGGSCTWTATSGVNWITVISGQSGTGDGLVQVMVAPNAGSARSGLLRIAGMELVVRQAGQ